MASLNGINVGREVVDEVVLRQPGEALLVDVEMGQRGGRRAALGEQAADRFALVQAEGRDVDRPTTFGASAPRAVMICPP